MPAFISYSQKDEAAYSSLCLALEGQHIDYWDPKTMRVGVSLKEQLKEGIKKCDVCVFLATRNSIDSEWCLAEIGAFWGAGLTVIVFMADPNLIEDQIPVQFQGDLWTRDVRKVAGAVKAEVARANEERKAESAERPKLVAEMSIGALYDFLSTTRASDNKTVREIIILLRESFLENQSDATASALPLLNGLIGAPKDSVIETSHQYWRHYFILKTNTGSWLGFSKDLINATSADGYSKCLLILTDEKECISALTVNTVWQQSNGRTGHGDIIASAGTSILGNITDMQDY